MKLLRWIIIAALLSIGVVAAQVPIVIQALPPRVPNPVVPIHQVFDYNVSDTSVLLGKVSMIWGPTDTTGTISAPVKGIPSFVYWPSYRNGWGLNQLQCIACVTVGTNPQWDWFLANHPDWITYKKDQVTPAWYSTSYKYVPLNFTDPSVVAFIETGAGSGGQTTNLLGALTTSYPGGYYRGVSLDNASYENVWSVSGYFKGAVPGPTCTEAAPSCGGTWTQLFPDVDPGGVAWSAASNVYLQTLHGWVNSQGKVMWCNFLKPSTTVVAIASIGAVICGDIILGEDWMMDGSELGHCADGMTPFYTPYAVWTGLFNYAKNITQSVTFAPVDYLCPGYNASNEPPSQVAWGVANFLMVRNGISYYSVKDQNAASFATYPSYFFPPCGTAAWSQNPPSPGYLNSGGTYERILTVGAGDPPDSVKCYVDVNPNDASSGTTSTYTLPAGIWQDQFGAPIPAGTNTMQPATGLVALKVG